MKNVLLAAAALVVLAAPAFAVGPESFTVDVSRGYQATPPAASRQAQPQQNQQAGHSNWAPRGQQAQGDQQVSSEEGSSATSARQPRATKASGKPRHHRSNAAGSPAAAPGSAPSHSPSAHGSAPSANGSAPGQPGEGSNPAGQR